MKKTHILGIIIIAIAIGAMMASLSDSSTYATFNQAVQNPDDEFHIVGKLNKNKETIYEPQKNTNLFTFYMIDNEGVEKKVYLHKNKPQDFERSEQIVLIGQVEGDAFHASEILMKCPSKYNAGAAQLSDNTSK